MYKFSLFSPSPPFFFLMKQNFLFPCFRWLSGLNRMTLRLKTRTACKYVSMLKKSVLFMNIFKNYLLFHIIKNSPYYCSLSPVKGQVLDRIHGKIISLTVTLLEHSLKPKVTTDWSDDRNFWSLGGVWWAWCKTDLSGTGCLSFWGGFKRDSKRQVHSSYNSLPLTNKFCCSA